MIILQAIFAIRKKLFVVLVLSMIIIPIWQGALAIDSQTSGWVNGDLPALTKGDQLSDPAQTTCYPASFTYRSFIDPNGSFNSTGRDVDKAVCATTNQLGAFGNSSGSADPYAYDFVTPNSVHAFRVVDASGRPSSLVPVPGQQAMFFGAADGNLYGGRSLRFYDDWASLGAFGPYYGNINETVFKLNPVSAMVQPLRDSLGTPIHMMDAYAFSPNGEWMVIEAYNLGLIRINTRTREKQLFSTEYYSYATGLRPKLTLAISNDGQSVVRSSFNLANTTVYDLTECQAAPFVVQATDNTTPGCRSRAVQADLLQRVSGFRGFIQMRFGGDGHSIRGVLSRDTAAGAREYYSMTYAVAGYTPVELDYLALGDSFSSGEGAFDYFNGTDTEDSRNRCHLSLKSYPYLIADTLNFSENNFHSVACSGARSLHYSSRAQHDNSDRFSWLPGEEKQKRYLEESPAEAVTISMIGNDIGFADKIKTCVTGLDACYHFKEDRQAVADEIYGKFQKLVDLYNDIKHKAPDAKVYVLGYPQLFATGADCDFNVRLDDEERQMSRGLVVYLNSVIKAAAENAGVKYIDVQDAFAGHQLCDSGTTAINGLTAGNDGGPLGLKVIGAESYHPNQLGHQLMAQALLSQSQNLTAVMPAPNPAKTPPYVGSSSYDALIGNAPGGNAAKRWTYSTLQALDVPIRGIPFVPDQVEEFLLPSSLFDVWLNSTPTHLGSVVTDADGHLVGQVTIPDTVPVGFHTLHVRGKNIAGEDIDLYKTIFVAASQDDIDGDGIANAAEKCLASEPANVDQDRDGIDDACDPLIPADTVAPTVIGIPDRQSNSNGWFDRDVTINWMATDPDPSSGQSALPEATIVNKEGVATYTSASTCDLAGNCATGSVEVRLDKTAPDIGYSLSASPSLYGWQNSGVTVTFSCADQTSGIDSCSLPETVSGDGMHLVAGTGVDKAGNSASVNVLVSLDTTKPVVTQQVAPLPNVSGWNNTDVLVTPHCSDNLSGIAACDSAVTLTTEGAHQSIISKALDNANNSSSVSTILNIDKTAPVLGLAAWTSNLKSTAGQATLSVPATDSLSGVAQAEYYVGETDPGVGRGVSMKVEADTVSANFGTDLSVGVHQITVRVRDQAGNWSLPFADLLTVYDSSSARMTGHHTISPSLSSGDNLPGLISKRQTDKATFAFNVRYGRAGQIYPNSDFQFHYQTGTRCNKPGKGQNCHNLKLNATSITSLTVQGPNDSKGTFQGAGQLTVDGVRSRVAFQVIGMDGERLSISSKDHITIKIFAFDSDPALAKPLYQVSTDVLHGNIRIRTR